MTLSTTDRFWHNVYHNSAQGIRQCVDECVEEVMDIVKRHGMPASGHDPIEGVAAAIMRYISQSADARESRPVMAAPVFIGMRPPFVAELAIGPQDNNEDRCPVCKSACDDKGRCVCDSFPECT